MENNLPCDIEFRLINQAEQRTLTGLLGKGKSINFLSLSFFLFLFLFILFLFLKKKFFFFFILGIGIYSATVAGLLHIQIKLGVPDLFVWSDKTTIGPKEKRKEILNVQDHNGQNFYFQVFFFFFFFFEKKKILIINISKKKKSTKIKIFKVIKKLLFLFHLY